MLSSHRLLDELSESYQFHFTNIFGEYIMNKLALIAAFAFLSLPGVASASEHSAPAEHAAEHAAPAAEEPAKH